MSFVLARKGVLMSDPSVQAMTTEQWHFEYEGLLAREEAKASTLARVFRDAVRAFREVLISVLGLNLLKRWIGATPEQAERLKDMTPFVPAAYLWTKPEVLEHWQQEALRDEGAEAAMKDEAFEAFSAALARGDLSEVDPRLLGTPDEGTEKFWNSVEVEQMLNRLGVRRVTRDRGEVDHTALPPADWEAMAARQSSMYAGEEK